MVPLHQTAQGLRPCGMALYDMLADLSAELNDKPVPALTRHAVNFADGSDGLRGKVWRERGHLLQEAGEGMSVVSFSQFVGDAASRNAKGKGHGALRERGEGTISFTAMMSYLMDNRDGIHRPKIQAMLAHRMQPQDRDELVADQLSRKQRANM